MSLGGCPMIKGFGLGPKQSSDVSRSRRRHSHYHLWHRAPEYVRQAPIYIRSTWPRKAHRSRHASVIECVNSDAIMQHRSVQAVRKPAQPVSSLIRLPGSSIQESTSTSSSEKKKSSLGKCEWVPSAAYSMPRQRTGRHQSKRYPFSRINNNVRWICRRKHRDEVKPPM